MRIEADSDTLIFSSGHTEYAHRGVIGLARLPPEYGGGFAVSHGWDGGIDWPPEFPNRLSALTADDMRELADHMIEMWTAFKAELPA